MDNSYRKPGQERRRHDRRKSDRRGSGSQNASPKLTVMLVDGETLVRSAIADLLARDSAIDVIARAGDEKTAVQAANGHKPDVIIYDPPAGVNAESVANTLSLLHEASPDSRTIVLTSREDPVFAQEVLRTGALSYMLTTEDPEDLLKAVSRTANGQASISPRIAVLIAHLNREDGADSLSDREKEVLKLVALGHTSSEIAEQLFLSPRTVESHRANMIKKLSVENRAGLVRYALDNDLVS